MSIMHTWVIDEFMEDRNSFLQGTILLEDAVQLLGYDLIRTKYIPFSEKSEVNLPEGLTKVIAHGTIGFLRLFQKKYPNLNPGGFYETPKFSTQHCLDTYKDLMLNYKGTVPNGVFPRKDMPNILPFLIEKYGPLHVRPNGVGKSFTGSVVGTHTFPVNSFSKDENEMIFCSSVVDILGEYRFVCSDSEIISGSQYRYERKLDQRKDIHPAAQRFVKEFVSNNIGPDSVYVIDVAVLEDESAKIIEFNNFSNCGLYMCDRVKIVETITRKVS